MESAELEWVWGNKENDWKYVKKIFNKELSLVFNQACKNCVVVCPWNVGQGNDSS